MRTHTHMCAQTHTHVRTNTQTHTYIHMNAYTYINTHALTVTHTNTHSVNHEYSRLSAQSDLDLPRASPHTACYLFIPMAMTDTHTYAEC